MPDYHIPSNVEELVAVPINPPKTLMLLLMKKFKLASFVETGTHYGKTTSWASDYFERVYTIEAQEKLFLETSKRLSHLPNVQFVLGNSAEKLAEITDRETNPSLFWLDAHWMGTGLTFGQNSECPVLDELQAVLRRDSGHFIFIDDARLFLSPPVMPLSISGWPAIDEILAPLREAGRYTVVFYDTIISVPAFAKDVTAAYCQKVSTLAHEESVRRKHSLQGRLTTNARKSLAALHSALRARSGSNSR